MNHDEKSYAIEEKLVQLRELKSGTKTFKQISDMITERRVSWINSNLREMESKYRNLSPPEQAYNIIFSEHMKINRALSKIMRLSPFFIEIHSYNFCPYLEACKKLNLDTRQVCKEINEQSIQEMGKIIYSKLKFGRDYNHIRPYKEFCREFIWIAG